MYIHMIIMISILYVMRSTTVSLLEIFLICIFPSFKPYVQHQQPPSQDTQLRHHNDTEELVDGTLLGFGTMRNTYLESVAMKLFVAEFVGIAWNSLLAWKIRPLQNMSWSELVSSTTKSVFQKSRCSKTWHRRLGDLSTLHSFLCLVQQSRVTVLPEKEGKVPIGTSVQNSIEAYHTYSPCSMTCQ